jgi:ArsR family metal-binding transcriptional regulator
VNNDFIQKLKEIMWDRQNDAVGDVAISKEGQELNELTGKTREALLQQSKDVNMAREIIGKLDNLISEEMAKREDACYWKGLGDGITLMNICRR